MSTDIKDKLNLIQKDKNLVDALSLKLIGIEKESLRLFKNGELANNHHPKSLGCSLTHKSITTDYAESQLELITSPHHKATDSLQELSDIHHFINHKIGDEQLLWPESIPPNLPRPKDIMVAKFGPSLKGQVKELYRTGLGYRYGKTMQLICGIHFNFSFSDNFWNIYFNQIESKQKWNQNDINQSYMAIIRNYMRISWLTTYLFGSSPVMNSKFITKDIAVANYLKAHKSDTYIATFGTSIRESGIGYHNKSNVFNLIDYNSINGYAHSLQKAVTTNDEDFENLGIYRGNKQIQINSNVLQIENEYYGTVRPKPNIKLTNGPVYKSLIDQGIYYLELRNLDLNPFANIGINLEQAMLLELIMYYCLLSESPAFDLKEKINIKKNVDTVALLGRQPYLKLKNSNKEIELSAWANQIFDNLIIIAEHFDQVISNQEQSYSEIVNKYKEYIKYPELTNSAQIIKYLIDNDCEYHELFLQKAIEYNDYFKNIALNQDTLNYYEQLVEESFLEKKQEEEITKNNNINLSKFFEEYYS